MCLGCNIGLSPIELKRRLWQVEQYRPSFYSVSDVVLISFPNVRAIERERLVHTFPMGQLYLPLPVLDHTHQLTIGSSWRVLFVQLVLAIARLAFSHSHSLSLV